MKKKEILIPAILEKRFSKIKKLSQISMNYVQIIQVDICDGKLTPQKTFASNFQKDSLLKLKKISKKIDLELDLIAEIDLKKLQKILLVEPKRIVLHFSGIKDWNNIFKQVRPAYKIGLGIWLSDDNKKISKILEKFKFDYIQIMGIEKVGFGGQKLSPRVFQKIKYFQKKFPKKIIQIDGGVKTDNAEKLKKVGATRLVSGSGFFETL